MQEEQTQLNRTSAELDQILINGLEELQSTDDIDTATRIIKETSPAITESKKKLVAAMHLAAETFDSSSNITLLQQLIKPIMDNPKTSENLPNEIIQALSTIASYKSE